MLLKASQFQLSKEHRVYVAEISELGLAKAPREFTLTDCPAEGQHRSFRFTGCDMSGDDVAGWNYEECDGPNKGLDFSQGHPPRRVSPLKVLIIND